MDGYAVYIMSNQAETLYVGVTNDLERRVWEHKTKKIPGFTQRYNLTKLVYFEQTPSVEAAIAREKELKGWRRDRKLDVIRSVNINMKDLSATWYDE
ncbi:GIY-YIG nuclease family protein [Patescibacteria group bacterium]|nr:GIY-YIG nuclease family protein [Patescibacteria group bacterium]MBU1448269.1 GIY-YIG nuclease family protein [Patescibacteria group bacterium]MBU2613425.1 GIY-YIG nuclease family protein [Patescibacteria group bacterium]